MPKDRHRSKRTPSERELEMLDALWDLGSGTVGDVRRHYNDVREEDLEYTTILTYLRNLDEKGWVRRSKEGRSHRYYPTTTRKFARDMAVNDLIHTLYGGRRDDFYVSLLRDPRLTPRLLQLLRVTLDARTGGAR